MRALILSISLALSANLFADKIEVSIAPYLNNKKGAITYTFDDGLRDQFTEALPIINKLGFKATFFIIPGLTPDSSAEAKEKKAGAWGGISWNELKEVLAKGHEIGNHSLEHKNLVSLDEKAIHHQIDTAQKLIHEKLGIHAHSFCCPYNSTNAKVSAIIDSKLPFRRKQLCGFGGEITSEAMNSRVNQAIKKGLWDVIMIHGISVGYDKFDDPQRLFDHWQYVKTVESEIWVDTFVAIASHTTLAASANLELTQKKNSLTCKISQNKTTAFNIQSPLTLIINLPPFKSVQAQQGTKQLPIMIKDEHILINGSLNNQAIEISWK